MAFVTKRSRKAQRSLWGFQQGFQNKLEKDNHNQNFSSVTSETWNRFFVRLHLTKEQTLSQESPLVFKAQCSSCRLLRYQVSVVNLQYKLFWWNRYIHSALTSIPSSRQEQIMFNLVLSPEQSSSHHSEHVWIQVTLWGLSISSIVPLLSKFHLVKASKTSASKEWWLKRILLQAQKFL